MTNPNEIIPGVLFYSYLSRTRKEKVGFLNHCTMVLQVSGNFLLETATEKLSMGAGEMLLIGRNQLGQITKTPAPGGNYETIVMVLQEDLLRKVALEENLEVHEKYNGPLNILVPPTEFLKGYFQSIVPYVRNPNPELADDIGLLKVKEGVKLLLHAMPQLRNLLFDFSEPHKIDLEKFMVSHFNYNLPIEKFAGLTGRSVASFKRDFQKTFGMAPRHWLLERRLLEARRLIENRNKKPSDFYLDLGFETLSHFSNSFKKKFGKSPSAYAGQ